MYRLHVYQCSLYNSVLFVPSFITENTCKFMTHYMSRHMDRDLNPSTHFWICGFQDHRNQPDSAIHVLTLHDFMAHATSFFPLLMRMDAAKAFRLGLNITDTGLIRTIGQDLQSCVIPLDHLDIHYIKKILVIVETTTRLRSEQYRCECTRL